MTDKTDVTICLGSSCFSRGNGKTLQEINAYLERNNLNHHVFFHGELCTGNCAKGPILKIADNLHEKIDPETAIDKLTESLNSNLQNP